jgi:heme exporter protein B
MNPVSAWRAGWLLTRRDLRLAMRRRGEWLQPLMFFVIVATLFPLTMDPEMSQLRDVAPGVLWVAALLSSLLALDLLFRDDAQDGSLEQLALAAVPFAWLLLAKTSAHWLLTGLPLVVVAPLVATALGVPAAALPSVAGALALGTVALSLVGAIGAGLTLGLRRGGALLALLVLPLCVPILIFGAHAAALAINGQSIAGALYLLAAFTMLAATLAPLAVAAAVRIGLE